MNNIKLKITFLEDVKETELKNFEKLYKMNYLGRGDELGEATFSKNGKIVNIKIEPYERKEEEERGVLTINDFTTYLVLKYKIKEITTESIKIEEPKVEELECEECKVDLETSSET